MTTIFISIAAYKDKLLPITINEAYSKAKYPHNLVFGVFEQNTDEFVYLMAPKDFRGVGRFYESFEQVADDEVIRMLGVANLIE